MDGCKNEYQTYVWHKAWIGCIQLYLNEFMWRRKSLKLSEVFTNIFGVIRAEYPLEAIDYYMDVTDFKFTSSDLHIENDEFEVSNINDDSLLETLTDEDETDNDECIVEKLITAGNENGEEIEEGNGSCSGWDLLGFGCPIPSQNPRFFFGYKCMDKRHLKTNKIETYMKK
jgi:hypothetical protein